MRGLTEQDRVGPQWLIIGRRSDGSRVVLAGRLRRHHCGADRRSGQRGWQTMNPFELHPGLRVMQAAVPPLFDQPTRKRALQELIGRLGTVEIVTPTKVAVVRWDDGSSGAWSADCLEAA